jgi:hypothetical protein
MSAFGALLGDRSTGLREMTDFMYVTSAAKDAAERLALDAEAQAPVGVEWLLGWLTG